jgi:hypothetical protein
MKKAKGEFQIKKRKHQELQKLYDAIKRSKVEPCYVNIDHYRVKLEPYSFDACHMYGLIRHNGRIRLAYLVEKDGLQASSPSYHVFFRKLQPMEVLAWASEVHENPKREVKNGK